MAIPDVPGLVIDAAPGRDGGDGNPYAPPLAPVGAPRDVFRPRRWHLAAAAVTCACLGVFGLVAAAVTGKLGWVVWSLAFAFVARVWRLQARARGRPIVRPCREGVEVRLVGGWSPGASKGAGKVVLASGSGSRVRTYRIPWPDLATAAAVRRTLAPALAVVGRPEGRDQVHELCLAEDEFSGPPAEVAAVLLELARDGPARAALPSWDEDS